MIRNLLLLIVFGMLHADQPASSTHSPEQMVSEIGGFLNETVYNKNIVYVDNMAQDDAYNPLTMSPVQLQEKLEQESYKIAQLLLNNEGVVPALYSILFFNNHDSDQILCSSFFVEEYSISSAQFFTNRELLFNNQLIVFETIENFIDKWNFLDIFANYPNNPILARLAIAFFKRASDDHHYHLDNICSYISQLDNTSNAALLRLMTEVFEHHIPDPAILMTLVEHHPAIAEHLIKTYWKKFEQSDLREKDFEQFYHFYAFCTKDTISLNKIIDIAEQHISVINPRYLLNIIVKDHPEFSQRLINSYIAMLEQYAQHNDITIFNEKLSILCNFFIEEKKTLNDRYCFSSAKEFIQLNYKMHKTTKLIEQLISIVDPAIVKSLLTGFSHLTNRLIGAYVNMYENYFHKYSFLRFCDLCLDKYIAKHIDASLLERIATLIKSHSLTTVTDLPINTPDLKAFIPNA